MLALTGNQKGVTLIEVVISIAILAMIILPVSGMFINSVKTNKNAEDILLAGQLAQKYLEEYKNKGISSSTGISDIPVSGSKSVSESGFTIKLSRGLNMAVNSYPNSFDISLMDLILDIETNGADKVGISNYNGNIGEFSLANNNLIKLTINKTPSLPNILVSHNADYGPQSARNQDVKLALICSGSKDVVLEVYNNTPNNATIYKVTNKGTNDVEMNIKSGKAALVYNNYTNVQNYNFVCPLTITVSKNNKVLAETHAIIR